MAASKGIVILGGGEEIDYLVQNIDKIGIPLVAYGPSTDPSSNAHTYCKKNKIRIIEDYKEAVALEPEFIFMMSYAPLIPQEMIEKVKFINVHGALLPRYRGMHGGTWALINGEEKAGYTIHLVDKGIDSGPIYFQSSVDVGISDTIVTVREKIKFSFEENILSQLKDIYNNGVSAVAQNENDAIHVCRRHPKDSRVDWTWSSKRIHDFVRSLCPPYTEGAATYFGETLLRIQRSEYKNLPSYYGNPGQIVSVYEDQSFLVKTGDSALRISFVEPEEHHDTFEKLRKMVGSRLK
ncbi:hypothetical protein F0237_16805 [Vibrio tubiashii]|uniref:Methionyl-tRNA formyltransferase n=1 Tax=Vibrio tubiashii TaxID=29498 RepID=A0AAE5GSE5_9VIBR|nr:formyltransferase family protein [Vibrio tubiashii]NOI82330.1 hypothetical protein [Vibrio tubiashii]